MVKPRRSVLISFGILVAALLLVSGNTALRYFGLLSERQTPGDVAALLGPAMEITWPQSDGPYPMAILLSGCNGPADNLPVLAEGLAEIGWASANVDSHRPRGFEDQAMWSLICAGQLFTGTERAGDLAVALDMVRGMPRVDASRIALIGTSHGGWTILDLLSLEGRGRVPPTLTEWPASIAEDGLSGVRDIVLYYPYCGPGTHVWRHGWEQAIPALFLLVEGDTVADEEDCLRVAEKAAEAGVPVDIEMITGVTHGFDQEEKAPLSVLRFDAVARRRALETVKARLMALPPS